jgi:hypothetical protein
MREKSRKTEGIVVLVGVVLCVVLTTWGSAAFAAAEQATVAKTLTVQATIFDPFVLRTIMVAGNSARDERESSPGLWNPNLRRPIRIPFRLPVRSTFRPGIAWRTTDL